MHDSVKSFPACIVVYKIQRPAIVLIGENIQHNRDTENNIFSKVSHLPL